MICSFNPIFYTLIREIFVLWGIYGKITIVL